MHGKLFFKSMLVLISLVTVTVTDIYFSPKSKLNTVKSGEKFRIIISIALNFYIFLSLNAMSERSTAEVRDSPSDTVIDGHAQKESTMGGIIILLTP